MTFPRVVFAFLALATIAGPAVAAPTIALSVKIGHPTIATQVSGSGFTANEAIDVYFDTTDEFLTTADSTGAFPNQPLNVPKDALPGSHWITAVGRQTGDSAQQLFTVRTDWTKYAFDAPNRGLNPYENVIDSSNAGTLAQAWTFAAGTIVGSPIVYGNLIYFGSDDHQLHALTTSGAVKWTRTMGGAIESTPAYANGIVYVGALNAKIFAYDRATGALKWSAVTVGANYSSPVVVANVLYVGSNRGQVHAFNATTGVTMWTTTIDPIHFSTPAVVNGILYIGSAFRAGGKLFALDANTGVVLWTYPTEYGEIEGAPAVANGLVYFASTYGKIYAVNARTGALLWSYATSGVVSTPSVANGTVFAGSRDGNVYALDAISGALKWKAPLDDKIVWSSLSLANGVGYIGGSLGIVYAFDLETGARLWSARTQSTVDSSPAVVNGMVYVGSTDRYLYAYALNGGKNAVYKPRLPPSYASLHPDHRLKSGK